MERNRTGVKKVGLGFSALLILMHHYDNCLTRLILNSQLDVMARVEFIKNLLSVPDVHSLFDILVTWHGVFYIQSRLFGLFFVGKPFSLKKQVDSLAIEIQAN